MHIRLATRRSVLALWQARHVQSRLMHHWPDITVEIVGITTRADRHATTALAQLGGKGVFVKALESALLAHQADIAVHSIKDMTVDIPDALCLAATLIRTAPCDAWVSVRYPHPAALPPDTRIATASLRRTYQAHCHFPPFMTCVPIRGNLDSRLKRLHSGEFEALILADAGLTRLREAVPLLQNTHCLPLSVDTFLPAPGQGALGVECRKADSEIAALLRPLNHCKTHYEVAAERSVARALGGSCFVPVAAHACCNPAGTQLHVTGEVGDAQTKVRYRHTETGPVDQAIVLGQAVAAALLQQGAGPLIAQYLSQGQ